MRAIAKRMSPCCHAQPRHFDQENAALATPQVTGETNVPPQTSPIEISPRLISYSGGDADDDFGLPNPTTRQCK
ncbi:hypothetical protein V496_02884 [Pseudogymnoascus sp. VKM F-4515 (FW-2607)]|nr:hypothetical protein V496_02884 [Pseudogymnoascus sp. VKM F-4515 (FW-2607)]